MSIKPEEVSLNFIYKLVNAIISDAKKDFWLRKCPDARSFLMNEKDCLAYWVEYCPCLHAQKTLKTLEEWVLGVEDGSITEIEIVQRYSNTTS